MPNYTTTKWLQVLLNFKCLVQNNVNMYEGGHKKGATMSIYSRLYNMLPVE